MLGDVLQVVGGLAELKKDGKYVAYNAFLEDYERKAEEIAGNPSVGLYGDIISKSVTLCAEKLKMVERVVRQDVEPATVFWLFVASFAITVIMEMLEKGINAEVILNDVIPEFKADFIYGYSYIETRAHTVLVYSASKAGNIISRINGLIHSEEERKSVFKSLKAYLREVNYPFDIRYPVVRERGVFGGKWRSLIVFGYPEASRGYERILTPGGVSTLFRRMASVLYMEFMVSEDGKSMLLVLNVRSSKLKRGNRLYRVVNSIVEHFVGVSLEELLASKEKIYSIPAEKLVRGIREALEGVPRRKLDEELKKFREGLVEEALRIVKSEPLQYRDKLSRFISSLELSRLYLRVMLGRRVLMKLEVEYMSIDSEDLLPYPGIKVLSKDIRNIADKIGETFHHPKLKFIVGVSLKGKIEDYGEPSIIEFTSEDNVFFHNMTREYVTELSYVLWKAANKITENIE